MRAKMILGIGVVLIAVGAGFWFFQVDQANAAPGALPYDDPAAVARGEVTYAENCAVCHGENLEGDPDWQSPGDDGRMRPPPHDANGHTWHHADGLLIELTKIGSAAYVGDGYQSNMVGFEDILSEQQILETLAYIKSTWPPRLIEIHNEINESAELAN